MVNIPLPSFLKRSAVPRNGDERRKTDFSIGGGSTPLQPSRDIEGSLQAYNENEVKPRHIPMSILLPPPEEKNAGEEEGKKSSEPQESTLEETNETDPTAGSTENSLRSLNTATPSVASALSASEDGEKKESHSRYSLFPDRGERYDAWLRKGKKLAERRMASNRSSKPELTAPTLTGKTGSSIPSTSGPE